MANLKDTIVLGNLTVTGKITGGDIQSSGGTGMGSVTSVTVQGNDGLTGSGTITSSGTITLSHGNTSDAANLTANGRTYVTGLTFDKFGHVTAYTTGTETVTQVTDTNTTYSLSKSGSTITLTGSDGSTTSVTDDNTNTTYSFVSGYDGFTVTPSGGSPTAVATESTKMFRIDTRSSNLAPYATGNYAGYTTVHLKDNSAIGITGEDTYSALMQIYPWGDNSGGSAHQLAYGTNGGIYHRYGKTSWSSWKRMAMTSDLANYVTLDGTQTITGTKTFTAANNFTNESLFTHSTYAPAWKDIASGVGKSSCFTRGAFMQLITGQILLPNATQSDSDTALDTTANTLKFQSMTAGAGGQPVTTTIATLNSNGDYTSSGYVRGSYFTSDGACGMKLSGGNEMNLSGSGNVMYIGYTTATGANPVYTYVFCNGSSSTSPNGVVRASSFTQTANNYPVVDCSGGDIKHIRKCSASEYNSLTKDSNTLYLVM